VERRAIEIAGDQGFHDRGGDVREDSARELADFDILAVDKSSTRDFFAFCEEVSAARRKRAASTYFEYFGCGVSRARKNKRHFQLDSGQLRF
jgi:hypothetical protein